MMEDTLAEMFEVTVNRMLVLIIATSMQAEEMELVIRMDRDFTRRVLFCFVLVSLYGASPKILDT